MVDFLYYCNSFEIYHFIELLNDLVFVSSSTLVYVTSGKAFFCVCVKKLKLYSLTRSRTLVHNPVKTTFKRSIHSMKCSVCSHGNSYEDVMCFFLLRKYCVCSK